MPAQGLRHFGKFNRPLHLLNCGLLSAEIVECMLRQKHVNVLTARRVFGGGGTLSPGVGLTTLDRATLHE